MVILTTGVPKTVSPNVEQRLDIREFLLNEDLKNIYLLALRDFQDADEKDFKSWYQIAGIHGRPYTPYDGVGPANGRPFGGYCTHNSILFLTWHRPYLALYEQAISERAVRIANSYTDPAKRARYTTAARSLRVPYWDWAADPDVPDIVSKEINVTVDHPTRGRIQIANPLYSYRFHRTRPDFGDNFRDENIWESRPQTLRHPSGGPPERSQSQPDSLEGTFLNQRLTLRDSVYNLLTQAPNYATFSNDSFRVGSRTWGSLEDVHGNVHVFAGRGGHMGEVDFAAFDPIFWLHHVNVDRLFAIWQGIQQLRPASLNWIIPEMNPGGTFTTPPRTIENENSPLTPFYRTGNQFWTSRDSRTTQAFNYTYPELARISHWTPAQQVSGLRSQVNMLYASTTAGPRVNALFRQGLEAAAPAQASAAVAQPSGSAPAAKVAAAVAPAPAPAVAAAAAKVVTTAKSAAVTQGAAQVPVSVPAKSVVPPPAKGYGSHEPPPPQGYGSSGHPGKGYPAKPPPPVTYTKAPPTKGYKPAPPPDDDDDDDYDGPGKPPPPGKDYNEWICEIVVEKYALKCSFIVHIFLGEPPADPNDWYTSPKLVGSNGIFANNADYTGCERCRTAYESHLLVRAMIPLTGALGDLPEYDITDLTPETVAPYLKQNLTWRIQTHEGVPVDPKDVAGLDIAVGYSKVRIPDSYKRFPVWDDLKYVPEVTEGAEYIVGRLAREEYDQ